MTGPEHYHEAERLLADAFDDGQRPPVDPSTGTEWVSQVIAAAQVHATLALAAATGYPGGANTRSEWAQAVLNG